MKPIIKVGFCVSYDWKLLKNSLPRVYDEADMICLSIDKDRKSWSGITYKFDEQQFNEWVVLIDIEKKITIYEDCFFIPHLSAMQNDSRQRNMMALKMGEGGWHIQVDCDEYFVDFKGFKNYLFKLNPNPTGWEKPFNVLVGLYDLFKKEEGGYLVVDPGRNRPFTQPLATTKPAYTSARLNGYFNRLSRHYVIHETWARGEDELRFKLSNWGHSSIELKNEEVRESYIKMWMAIDRNNYRFIRKFHFVVPFIWDKLIFVKGENIEELIRNFRPTIKIHPGFLILYNSRLYAKIRQVLQRIMSTI